MKTSELTDTLLDLWVAKAQGKQNCFISPKFDACWDNELTDDNDSQDGIYSPSTNWSQGGPIIEREQIFLGPMTLSGSMWSAQCQNAPRIDSKGTALVAAMRAYLVATFGDEVPDETN